MLAKAELISLQSALMLTKAALIALASERMLTQSERMLTQSSLMLAPKNLMLEQKPLMLIERNFILFPSALMLAKAALMVLQPECKLTQLALISHLPYLLVNSFLLFILAFSLLIHPYIIHQILQRQRLIINRPSPRTLVAKGQIQQ